MKVSLIKGGKFADHRGVLHFVNEANPGQYQRFYLITHSDINVIRAWQGHKIEEKAFYAILGGFIIAVVRPASMENPTYNEIPEFFRLTKENNEFLRVPAGYYTGIKALLPNSTLLVLSSLDFAGSKADDYRQPFDKWVQWDAVE